MSDDSYAEVLKTIDCMAPKKWWICERRLAMTLGFNFRDNKGCLYPDKIALMKFVKEGLKKKLSIKPEEVHAPNGLNLHGNKVGKCYCPKVGEATNGCVLDTPRPRWLYSKTGVSLSRDDSFIFLNCSRAHFRSFIQLVLILAFVATLLGRYNW